jgi:hypothetical protein
MRLWPSVSITTVNHWDLGLVFVMSVGSSHASLDGVSDSRSLIMQDVLITAHTAHC